MKKRLCLLILPVLLTTSCTTHLVENIEMTNEEIEALHAKGETATINTLEAKSQLSIKISGKLIGENAAATRIKKNHYKMNFNKVVNPKSLVLSTISTGRAREIDGHANMKGERYFNGVNKEYQKVSYDGEIKKSCSNSSGSDWNLKSILTFYSLDDYPIYDFELESYTPQITKSAGIYKFTYNVPEILVERFSDGGNKIITVYQAIKTYSCNENGLLTQKTTSAKYSSRDVIRKETMELEYNNRLDIKYNHHLKVNLPSNLNTYCTNK